jgi:D-glycero-beta-D-manno-heptose 1-phosphate adenylyltransferase
MIRAEYGENENKILARNGREMAPIAPMNTSSEKKIGFVQPAAKLCGWPELLARRAEWRASGQTVVWTNGCFDLLHAGHVKSLLAARKLGDVLVVGLNSDSSVRQLKGPGRPIMLEAERAEILAAMACVDAVLIFDELTPEHALERLQPEIHCKGADYGRTGKPVPEAKIVEAYGGRVAFLPMLQGLSTTDIVEQIRKGTG